MSIDGLSGLILMVFGVNENKRKKIQPPPLKVVKEYVFLPSCFLRYDVVKDSLGIDCVKIGR